ncbi:dihydroneopterin aldolase [Limosilactobacillus kribbianus]|uniref:dihydroneopterin aldolase n=1 Tax=Limosilactobacillus kribbianus TaxID=2982695 RepID=UPI002263B31B|nr:dihydroneopterin aldolase [Limosilactobacillus kribbianus]
MILIDGVITIGKIRLNNMVFHTYNGVFSAERQLGQKLEIDCEMTYPIERAVVHDQLDETVSYADVYEAIRQFVQDHHYQLIESLANHLGQSLLEKFPRLQEIRLKIRKYNLPIDGVLDNAEIEVHFTNDHTN